MLHILSEHQKTKKPVSRNLKTFCHSIRLSWTFVFAYITIKIGLPFIPVLKSD